jgi:hypothetical protein
MGGEKPRGLFLLPTPAIARAEARPEVLLRIDHRADSDGFCAAMETQAGIELRNQ